MIDQYICQYGRRLYGLCLTLCADRAEADDLYQDTWLQVVKNISRYDASRDFEPWLTKICVNLYRNALRRLAKSPVLPFRTNEEKDFLTKYMEKALGEAKFSLLQSILGNEEFALYKTLQEMKHTTGIQARMPYTVQGL